MKCPDNLGQKWETLRRKIAWRGSAATLLTCLEIRLVRRLSRVSSTANVAGSVTEVLGVGEVRCRCKAALCSGVGHGLGFWRPALLDSIE
jgi:hypothetical protein